MVRREQPDTPKCGQLPSEASIRAGVGRVVGSLSSGQSRRSVTSSLTVASSTAPPQTRRCELLADTGFGEGGPITGFVRNPVIGSLISATAVWSNRGKL
jgi:hypothetical protein